MARPGEFVPEYIVTANDMNALPGGVLGYAQVTSSQGSITSEVDLTGLTVTVDVPANRRVKIHAEGLFSCTSSPNTVTLLIKEDTTVLRRSRLRLESSNGADATCSVVIAPSSGSHTYKLAAARQVGTGTATLDATTEPAWVLVEDIGPA